jgi:hypothetical protein
MMATEEKTATASASPVDRSNSAQDAKQQRGTIAAAIERTVTGDTAPSGPQHSVGEGTGEQQRVQVRISPEAPIACTSHGSHVRALLLLFAGRSCIAWHIMMDGSSWTCMQHTATHIQ